MTKKYQDYQTKVSRLQQEINRLIRIDEEYEMSKTGKKKDETYNSYSDDDNFNVANADGQKKKKGKYTYSNAFDYGERTSMAFDSQ